MNHFFCTDSSKRDNENLILAHNRSVPNRNPDLVRLLPVFLQSPKENGIGCPFGFFMKKKTFRICPVFLPKDFINRLTELKKKIKTSRQCFFALRTSGTPPVDSPAAGFPQLFAVGGRRSCCGIEKIFVKVKALPV